MISLAGQKPAVFSGHHGLPDLNAAAQANLPDATRFDDLSAAQQNAMLRNTLVHPAIVALADQPRPEWLKYLFALAHAGHCGATDAHDLALVWSQTSSRFTSVADFNQAWQSFRLRPDGITVGTLFDAAIQAGIDLSQWRNAAPGTGSVTTVASAASKLAAAFSVPAVLAPFFSRVKSEAASLHAVLWLVWGLLIRGEITAIVGQGASAKTAFAILMAVLLAAGRTYIGPFRVNTRPGGMRVAFISAEEDPGRIALLVAAACSVLGLTAAERAAVSSNLVIHDAGASGWCFGEPPARSRDGVAADGQDRGRDELVAALAQYKPDVLILDTLAALFHLPSENDNSAITTLMRRLTRVARAANCAVLLLHHTPKMTRETAAAQRGEATLARGGGAIANSARVVLSITSPLATEAAGFAMRGSKPDSTRRIEHVKINDTRPMDPAYFEIKSVQVKVHDGTDHAVRAVEFIPPPPAASASGGITDPVRSVAMKAIDAGVLDDHGAKVPLSPGGGRNTRRDAIQVIGAALMNAKPGLAEAHARTVAREVLKDLRDRIGCVIEQDVQVPQYKSDGQPNGPRKGRGLVCRWDLAPWVVASPQTVTVDQQDAPARDAEALDQPPTEPTGRDPDHGARRS